jgi:hypothetical protein
MDSHFRDSRAYAPVVDQKYWSTIICFFLSCLKAQRKTGSFALPLLHDSRSCHDCSHQNTTVCLLHLNTTVCLLRLFDRTQA